MILTAADLEELTARKRPAAQADVLRAMSIPFRLRPDGSVVVLRAAVEAALGAPTEGRRPRLRLPA